jgi:hypothetical protein
LFFVAIQLRARKKVAMGLFGKSQEKNPKDMVKLFVELNMFDEIICGFELTVRCVHSSRYKSGHTK